MPRLRMSRIWVVKNRLGGYIVWGRTKGKDPYDRILAQRKTKKDADIIAREARKAFL